MKVLVIGANGMLGSAVFRVLMKQKDITVFGTVRNPSTLNLFSEEASSQLISGINVENRQCFIELFNTIRPDVVINCAGLTKHQVNSENPLYALPVNSLFPNQLSELCELTGVRLIHVSTDCVFSGSKGNYSEADIPDAHDVYGRSKALGEILAPHAVTLRTSIIGHELGTQYGLLEWFLAQEGKCLGYSKAIFSGLPTVVFAKIIYDLVLSNDALSGLYHVAVDPISKYDLLNLIAERYSKRIEIIPDDSVVIDRSLDPQMFAAATGYTAPSWDDIIDTMYKNR